MSKNKFSLKVAALSGIGFAVVFSAFSLAFYFGDWHRVTFVFFTGLFFGFVAAPEIEPKAFKNAAFFQISSGSLSGLLVALAFQLDVQAVLLGALIGGLLGWSAPLWAKHVPIP
jgi:uncharacterized membrane protein